MTNTAQYRALNSFRALGCVLVAFAHWPSDFLLGLPGINLAGTLVDFFFVLSGFVIGANYSSRLVDGPSAVRFAWLRIGRLYPLHVLTLVAMVAFEALSAGASYFSTGSTGAAFTGNRDPHAILTNLGLVQIFFGSDIEDVWNGPAWSVCAELWVYFLFAAVTFFSGRNRFAAYALVIGVSWTILAIWSPLGLYDTRSFSVFRAAVGFFTGIFIWQALDAIGDRPDIGSRHRWAWTAIEGAALVMPVYFTLFTGANRAISLAAPLFVAGFIMIFAMEKGGFSRILRNRYLVFGGVLSFSVYMIHRPLIMAAWGACRFVQWLTGLPMTHLDAGGNIHFGPNPIVGDLMFIPYIVVVFGLSWLSWRYFEEPCRAAFARVRIGRSLASASRPAAANTQHAE